MVQATCPDLLSNTKLRKNISRQIVGRYFAGNFAEEGQGAADVHGDKVGGDLGVS